MRVTVTINIDDRLVAFFKKLFTKRKIPLYILIMVLTVTVAHTQLTKINNQNIFMPGDNIDAGRINNNFDVLRNTINNSIISDISTFESDIEYLVTDFDARIDTIKSGLATSMNETIPEGIIAMWSGATIPTGWTLCDGMDNKGNPDESVPDLRDKFIVGADNSINPPDGAFTFGDFNASPKHTHPLKHRHLGTTTLQGSHDHRWAHINKSSGSWTAYSSLGGFNLFSGFDPNDVLYDIGTDNTPNTDQYIPLSVDVSNPLPDNLDLYTSKQGDHDHDFNIREDTLESGEALAIPPYYALYYIMRKNLD